jgi:2-succinyl-6-hydroxy-2,4-cyclohexadiene-1-carboxylate synthase
MRLDINGIALNVEQAGQGCPLLLLHGFTGSAAGWAPYAFALARSARTIAVDLIGHGESDAPADADRYRMERCVEDLVSLLDALHIDRADVLGYSMGGRVALHLASVARSRIRALVLESASPGITDAAGRRARLAADAELAQVIERDGVEAFVDRWERMPLFATQASLPRDGRARLRAQRLKNRAIGLANSLRGMGVGQQTPLWDSLFGIGAPTLLLAGTLDQNYRELARAMAAAMPNARVVVVPDAGHNVHLEQPAAFLRLVQEFLSSGRDREGATVAPGHAQRRRPTDCSDH